MIRRRVRPSLPSPLPAFVLGASVLAACNVPTVGGPLVFTRDGAAAAAPDGGGSGGDAGAAAALVGDPCAADGDCASGDCADRTWCTRACASDGDCGANSAGETGVCAMASTGQVACYPGCATGGDCAAYPGTQCMQLASGRAACSPP